MLPMPVAVLLGFLAAGAAFMAAPEMGAAEANAAMRRACSEFQAVRPTVQCPPLMREVWRTDWLLVAAVLLVGALGIATLGRKPNTLMSVVSRGRRASPLAVQASPSMWRRLGEEADDERRLIQL